MQLSIQGFSQVFISGEVKNAPVDAQVMLTYYNNTIEYTEVEAINVLLDSLGCFKSTFTLNKTTPAKLTISDEYTNVFIEASDSLHIIVDFSAFDETIKYFGRGAANNNYLAADLLANFTKKANKYNHFKSAEKFELYIDSLEKSNVEFLKSHDSPEFTTAFRNYINVTTRYRFINPRWMFTIEYDRSTRSFRIKKLPKEYYDFLKTIDLNDELAFDNITYQIALSRYLSEVEELKIMYPDSISPDQKAKIRIQKNYDYRKSIFKNKVLDDQLTRYLKRNIGLVISDIKFTDELINDYKSVCKNPEYISIIDEIYSKAINLSSGKNAPDFTLINEKNEPNSLSSFNGKIVFIDFWATWCAPCLVAMPKTIDLMNKFKDNKEVIFLYVNVNDDKEKWRNYISKKKIGGEHWYADKKQSAELYKLYNFRGIPHYVLIDKKGKLVNANAEFTKEPEKLILEAIKLK